MKVEGALIVAAATVVLYVSGYSYIHGYYSFFEVSPSELDLSLNETMAHSARASFDFMRKFGFKAILITFVFLLVIFAIFGMPRVTPERCVASLATAAAAILIPAMGLSNNLGREHAAGEADALPIVYLIDRNAGVHKYDNYFNYLDVRFLASAPNYNIVFSIAAEPTRNGEREVRTLRVPHSTEEIVIMRFFR